MINLEKEETTRTFKFTLGNGRAGVVKINQQCFDNVDDDWREYFYPLYSDESIVKHIVWNMINNGLTLPRMDGWANLPESYAKIVELDYQDLDVESVEEIN